MKNNSQHNTDILLQNADLLQRIISVKNKSKKRVLITETWLIYMFILIATVGISSAITTFSQPMDMIGLSFLIYFFVMIPVRHQHNSINKDIKALAESVHFLLEKEQD